MGAERFLRPGRRLQLDCNSRSKESRSWPNPIIDFKSNSGSSGNPDRRKRSCARSRNAATRQRWPQHRRRRASKAGHSLSTAAARHPGTDFRRRDFRDRRCQPTRGAHRGACRGLPSSSPPGRKFGAANCGTVAVARQFPPCLPLAHASLRASRCQRPSPQKSVRPAYSPRGRLTPTVRLHGTPG